MGAGAWRSFIRASSGFLKLLLFNCRVYVWSLGNAKPSGQGSQLAPELWGAPSGLGSRQEASLSQEHFSPRRRDLAGASHRWTHGDSGGSQKGLEPQWKEKE